MCAFLYHGRRISMSMYDLRMISAGLLLCERIPRARVQAEMELMVGQVGAQDALFAHALDTVLTLLGAPIALGFTVDEHQTLERTMLRCAHPQHEYAVRPLVRRLPNLEPIDPFSPRRAAACGATVMWAGDAGGDEALAASMYGRHLRHHGFLPPVVLFFRRDGRIAAGLALLRPVGGRPFDATAVQMLGRMHPFLEAALMLPAPAAAPEPQPAPMAALLTAREAEVAALVAGGSTNADVAAHLGMSEATVKTHLTKVYAKLGVRTRTQLAVLLPRPAIPDGAVAV
jgi:DNA-binding CsgD family transcriptional regulator